MVRTNICRPIFKPQMFTALHLSRCLSFSHLIHHLGKCTVYILGMIYSVYLILRNLYLLTSKISFHPTMQCSSFKVCQSKYNICIYLNLQISCLVPFELQIFVENWKKLTPVKCKLSTPGFIVKEYKQVVRLTFVLGWDDLTDTASLIWKYKR